MAALPCSSLSLFLFVAGVVGQILSGRAPPGQFVAALVLRMAGVAAQPLEGDLVGLEQGHEPHPEVHVLDGLLVALDPGMPDPAGKPALLDGVAQVLRVGVEGDLAGLRQEVQSVDGRQDLHAVVGGVGEAAADLLAGLGALQCKDGGPPAGAGIAEAGAVCVDDDVFQACSLWKKALAGRWGRMSIPQSWMGRQR